MSNQTYLLVNHMYFPVAQGATDERMVTPEAGEKWHNVSFPKGLPIEMLEKIVASRLEEAFNGGADNVLISPIDKNILGNLALDILPSLRKKAKTKHVRPPLGIKPRFILDEYRRVEILEAIDRFIDAGEPINIAWIEEYNEIVKRLKK